MLSSQQVFPRLPLSLIDGYANPSGAINTTLGKYEA